MSKIIGLTGGIGSGKTTIAKLFETMGIAIFIADEEGKKATNLPEIKQKIVNLFGNAVLTDNEIDRSKLSTIVFNNISHLQMLNKIIHPMVKKIFEAWCITNKNSAYILYESAILFETNSGNNFFKTITVSAPLDIRINRIKLRNGWDEDQIKSRISNQWTDKQREEKADYTITNIDLNDTKNQIKSIYEDLNKY